MKNATTVIAILALIWSITSDIFDVRNEGILILDCVSPNWDIVYPVTAVTAGSILVFLFRDLLMRLFPAYRFKLLEPDIQKCLSGTQSEQTFSFFELSTEPERRLLFRKLSILGIKTPPASDKPDYSILIEFLTRMKVCSAVDGLKAARASARDLLGA